MVSNTEKTRLVSRSMTLLAIAAGISLLFATLVVTAVSPMSKAYAQSSGKTPKIDHNVKKDKPGMRENNKQDGVIDPDMYTYTRIYINGASLTGEGDYGVEDGAAAVASETASGNAEVTLGFSDCEPDTSAVFDVVARHTINYAASIPGGTAASSLSVSGSVSSLGKTTAFTSVLKSSETPKEGTWSTKYRETKQVDAHGTAGMPGRTVELSGNYSSVSERTTEGKLGEGTSDSATVNKSIEQQFVLGCGQSTIIRADAEMGITMQLTEKSNSDTGWFTSSLTFFVGNEFTVGNATIIKNGKHVGEINPLGKIAMLDTPLINTPDGTLVANLPEQFASMREPLPVAFVNGAYASAIFLPENSAATEIMIQSSNEDVVMPSPSSVAVAAGKKLALFGLEPVGAGNATVTVVIPSYNFEQSFDVNVVDFDDLGPTAIYLPAEDNYIEVAEGNQGFVSIARSLSGQMLDNSTEVTIETSDSGVIRLADSTMQIDPGQEKLKIPVQGLKAGLATLSIRQTNNSDIAIPVLLRVTSPLETVNVGKPALVTATGSEANQVSAGQQVLIQSEISSSAISVGPKIAGEERPFAYIIQVKDAQNNVQSLSWQMGDICDDKPMTLAQSWTPVEAGKYTIDILVWESIEQPVPLAPVTHLDVTVG